VGARAGQSTRRDGSFSFTGRRRNTRLVSDWSSDVCSSDLDHRGRRRLGRGHRLRLLRDAADGLAVLLMYTAPARPNGNGPVVVRSEERRVGREGGGGGRRGQ